MSASRDLLSCPQVGGTVLDDVWMFVSLYCLWTSFLFSVSCYLRKYWTGFVHYAYFLHYPLPFWMQFVFELAGRIIVEIFPVGWHFFVGFVVGVLVQLNVYYRGFYAFVRLNRWWHAVLCGYHLMFYADWIVYILVFFFQLGFGALIGFTGCIYIADGHFVHFSRWDVLVLVIIAIVVTFYKTNVG